MIAGVPPDDVEDAVEGAVNVPTCVRTIANGRPIRVIWENEVGGLTFEVGNGDDRVFVKWSPDSAEIDLNQETARMRWARRYTTVPRVLDDGTDDDGMWFVTAALAGNNAVSERWTRDPLAAVRAIGSGLRALHEALPVDDCPFSWSAEERIADAHRRAAHRLDPSRWGDEHRHLSVDEALAIVDAPPPIDALVVCHGDACAPNTLIDDDGRCSGHVDLGSLGVADRWADLAVATWSSQWNYGPGWEDELLAAYGLPADPERTRYYRLLWDLGP